MKFTYRPSASLWHNRVWLNINSNRHTEYMLIRTVEGLLAPTDYKASNTIYVGKEWLKEHLTKEEFASYVAERILRDGTWNSHSR